MLECTRRNLVKFIAAVQKSAYRRIHQRWNPGHVCEDVQIYQAFPTRPTILVTVFVLQHLSVKPLDEKIENPCLCLWKLHGADDRLFEARVKSCFEEWRVVANEIFVDAEVFELLPNFDVDDFGGDGSGSRSVLPS